MGTSSLDSLLIWREGKLIRDMVVVDDGDDGDVMMMVVVMMMLPLV